MGTSTSYSAPPSWGDLKGDVTRAAGDGTVTRDKAGQLVRDFIAHNGGARAMAGRTGGGRGQAGGAVAGGGAARGIASRLGGFIADVSRFGLEGALRNAGLADLAGRTVQEILNSLLDRIGGEASTIDDVDARMALSRLQEKFFAEAETMEELEQLLNSQVHQFDGLLQDFFGFYLHEVFCRVFFERLVQRVGEVVAHSFLGDIGDFINSTLANRAAHNIADVNWGSTEGQALVSEIMETTLHVFGG
jgi:hypothetical protein